VLTLTDASGAVDLNLPGSFTSNQIAVTNVAGVGATVGILPVRTLGWVGGSGTAFGMAANWNDLTNGLDPAQMGPDAADTVDFDSSNGAVDGPGTVAALDIGTTGNGVLQLSSGTIVTGTLDAGIVLGSDGQLGLTGAGTELMVTGSAAVADDGTGVLSVLSGATFAAQSLTIGSQTDSSGALVVSGSGSLLSISGQLNIGTALGTGDLTVGPGATVNAAVVNLQGGVVLEGGVLDPTVYIENGGSTTGGFGTIASDFILLEGTILSNGSKSGKQTEVVEGTLVGGGTADIKGSVSVNGPGILQIGTHDTIELTGAVLNAATTTFTDNLTPTGTYTVNNSVIDVVFQDTTGLLQLDNIGGFAGTIATWHAGDAFVATGETLSNPSVSNGDTLLVQDTGPNAGAGGIDTIIFASAIDAGGFSIVNGNTLVACFAAGTRIETADGPVAVEDLRVRDSVVTMTGAGFHRGTGQASTDRVATDGHAPIVWIGQRRVNCLTHPAPETVWPVVVRAGALGPRQPARDLYLSPDHALFVNHVLVPVKLLINGTSIAQVERPSVTYYHIELPRHAVILAEGLPVESYLDAGDRANFRPDEKTIRLQPNFAPRLTPDSGRLWETRGAARLIVTGPELAAARRTVTRAGEISARAAAATVPARAQSRPAAGR
jgi:T5SS/PEP-CTERM-associated repeat protein